MQSRTKKFKWPSHIHYLKDNHPIKITDQIADQKINEGDLYHDEKEWQDVLLGRIKSLSTFIPGVIKKAIDEKKKGIRLCDAPLEDPDFQAFIKLIIRAAPVCS